MAKGKISTADEERERERTTDMGWHDEMNELVERRFCILMIVRRYAEGRLSYRRDTTENDGKKKKKGNINAPRLSPRYSNTVKCRARAPSTRYLDAARAETSCVSPDRKSFEKFLNSCVQFLVFMLEKVNRQIE